MYRPLRRLFLFVCVSAVAPAAIALAATAAATTQPATNVSATSATLNGTVQTAGGTTSYQFQYGTTTSYDKATPSQAITGSANKSVPVSAAITSLAPGTTYHFRLVVITNKGSQSQSTSNGNDLTFTTQPAGKILLSRTTLRVNGSLIAVPLKCASELPCNGRFSINTRALIVRTHKIGNVGCATKLFALPAGAQKTVKANVRAACLSLLKKAPHHRIRGKFTSRPRTGQLGVVQKVTLVLK